MFLLAGYILLQPLVKIVAGGQFGFAYRAV